MPALRFGLLASDVTYSFNPLQDRLLFGPTVSAANVQLTAMPGQTKVYAAGKSITLDTPIQTLGSANVVFADGSVLHIGDDLPDTSGDDDANGLLGTAGADQLLGLAGDDMLVGGSGNDVLDGGAGYDWMEGGIGDDFYVAEPYWDTLVELPDEGTDTILLTTGGWFALSENLENLWMGPGVSASIWGNALANHIAGGSLTDELNGAEGNDTLLGNAGDDRLYGGEGADVMRGGPGSDLYQVDNVGDRVFEAAEGGLDTVYSSVDFRLGGNVEHLFLTAPDTAGVGNALPNTLYGGAGRQALYGRDGDDMLYGGADADVMRGEQGSDVYWVDNAADRVYEVSDAGWDVVHASVSFTLGADLEELRLYTPGAAGIGNSLANRLIGAGHSVLSGREGDDTLQGSGDQTMRGGAGNDLYLIDSLDDVAIELPDEGVDTVRSDYGWLLGANFENLLLGGTWAADGWGNKLANVIVGNDQRNHLYGQGGNDTLSGGGGDDTVDGGNGADHMLGGEGNDLYVVNSPSDVLVEHANEGTDTVQAPFSFVLQPDFEHLILTGVAAVNGTGNASSNRLTGNAAANRLEGEAGNDTLDGGGGADTLIGGSGDDFYIVGAPDNWLIELQGAGRDTVQSTVSLTLADNLEDLRLIGTAEAGIGNALDNRLVGNDSRNLLLGGAGNDTLEGVGVYGGDTLSGGDGNDLLVYGHGNIMDGGGGLDVVRATLGIASLYGVGGTIIRNVEQIDMVDGRLSFLYFDVPGVASATGDDCILRVTGDPGDRMVSQDLWFLAGEVVEGGTAFKQYERDGVRIQLQADLDLGYLEGSFLVPEGRPDLGFQIDVPGYSPSASAVAGDINGDGIADMLFGDPTQAGWTYVVFGAAERPANFAPSLENGEAIRIVGEAGGDLSGSSVSGVGDVNGDGLQDFLIGAPRRDATAADSGSAYVVFGTATGLPSVPALAQLDGTNGFELTGVLAGARTGSAVSGVGDFNSDGYADVVISAQRASYNGADSGAVYLVFGHAGPFAPELNLASLDGSIGFRVQGTVSLDWVDDGRLAGDINGDGYSDLVFTARGFDGTEAGGSAFVVFGSDTPFAPVLDLAALNGINGFRLDGLATNKLGVGSANSLGDVNGDGFDDLLIAAFSQKVIVFGKASGFSAVTSISQLVSQAGAAAVTTQDAYEAVIGHGAAGDVNGDGFGDILLQSNYATYVVYGGPALPATISLAELDGTNGLRIFNTNSYKGSSGDVNGDGLADLLLTRPANVGTATVLYGDDFGMGVWLRGGSENDELLGTPLAERFAAGTGNDTLHGGGGADVLYAGAGDDVISVPDAFFFVADGGGGSDTLRLEGQGFELDLRSTDFKVESIEIIDLSSAGSHSLTLRRVDLLNLSESGNSVTVKGTSEDEVLILDGTWTAEAPSEAYYHYTSGAAHLYVETGLAISFQLDNVTLT